MYREQTTHLLLQQNNIPVNYLHKTIFDLRDSLRCAAEISPANPRTPTTSCPAFYAQSTFPSPIYKNQYNRHSHRLFTKNRHYRQPFTRNQLPKDNGLNRISRRIPHIHDKLPPAPPFQTNKATPAYGLSSKTHLDY